MSIRVTKRAYIPHEESPSFRYPDEMEKILTYLNENGTLQITDKEVEDFYSEFSDEWAASWLTASDQILGYFAEWLSKKEVTL